jgi:hypothetical protein
MIHELKTLPEYFNAVANETKTFEVRKSDRPFHVGDYLALNEFENGKYTGLCMMVRITYILKDKEYCKSGYWILGITCCGIITKRDPFSEARLTYEGIPVYGERETNE